MSRIVAFGCSNTFGQGLPDCPVYRSDSNPSKYAWPAFLGRLINRPVLNLGIPGASNLEILHCISNTVITASDHVYVLWSYLERWSVLRQSGTMQIGPWLAEIPKKRKMINSYYKFFHDDYHANFLYPLLLREAERILKLQTDNIVFMEPHNTHISPRSAVNINLQQLATDFPLGLDNFHIGPRAHQYIAEQLAQL